MRHGTITCDRCHREAAEEYAQQNGWVGFRIESIVGGSMYGYRRDLCDKCAGMVLEFVEAQ